MSTVLTDRVMVLLGAGASKDAGLPLTEELAERLVRRLDDDLKTLDPWHRPAQEPIVRALHVVYGAMVAHASERGNSPLAAVNVERLVSAVRLLRDRSNHEAAPFVTQWRPSIEEVDSHPLSVSDSDLENHFKADRNFSFPVRGLRDEIAEIARDVASPGSGETFRVLEHQLVREICRILGSPSSVRYLSPLADLAKSQAGGLDIATLTYDTTIEQMAENEGVPVDTGMDRWRPGLGLTFEPTAGHINLLKLHGSVDWTRSKAKDSKSAADPLLKDVYLHGVDPLTNENPVIVVGDREKLSVEGPTLALMGAFEASLARAARLVVVGYSFGDDHINTVTRNWLGSDSTRLITILDPSWPAPEHMVAGPDTEYELRDALRFVAGYSLAIVDGRVLVIKAKAGDALRSALQELPLKSRNPEISVVACLDSQPYVQITNRGYELETLIVRAFPMKNSPRWQAIENLRAAPDVGGGLDLKFVR